MDSALAFSAVLVQAGAGGSLLAALLPFWRGIRPGFRTLLGFCCWLLLLAGGWGARSGLGVAASLPPLLAASWFRRRALGGRAAMALSGVIGLLSLGRSGGVLGLAVAAAGAWVLGAVLDGLLLGHWYIFDRGAPVAPLQRTAEVLLGGVVVASLAAFAVRGKEVVEGLSPLLYVGAVRTWIALGLLAVVGLLALFIRALAREGSTRSATGFFYLALLLAFPAEFAAAVGLFAHPG